MRPRQAGGPVCGQQKDRVSASVSMAVASHGAVLGGVTAQGGGEQRHVQLKQELVTCVARTTSGAVPANRSGSLPAPVMLGAAPRALWASFRLHIHGWVVLRLLALSTAGLIFCCQTPAARSLSARGVISGISGQSRDQQPSGLGSRTTPAVLGLALPQDWKSFGPLRLKCSQRLPWHRSKPKTAALAQVQQSKAKLKGKAPGC